MKQKVLSLSFRVVAVLILTAVLIICSGADPVRAVSVFFYAVFGNLNGFAEVFVRATPLIFLGLAIALSFRTGFFNLGAEGQFYMGALAATASVVYTSTLPGLLRIIIACVAAALAGGVWSIIPAYMKNRMGISETISTIMFNYIAIMFVGLAIRGFLHDNSTPEPQSIQILEEVRLSQLLYPTRLHSGLILAVFAAVVVWFLLYRTTIGYELRMTGLNKRAALVNGLPVNRCLILSALLAGGLAGMAGMNEILGVQYRLLEGVSGGNGYTAVLIALLAKNHPLGVVLASIGYSAILVGATTMQRHLGVPSSIVSIIVGFIVLMILCNDFGKIWREHRKEHASHVE